MRVASFNVENLFSRVRAMNLETWDDGRPILNAYAELNTIFQNDVYTAANRVRIIELLTSLGLANRDDAGRWAILRQNRGDLLIRRKNQPPEVVATGRADWIGWLELKREAVDEIATRNVARVLAEVNADVVGVVEAEDRVALCRFNEDVLDNTQGMVYEHIMLIDGNDERGIDVAIMTKATHPIEAIRSHVDDVDGHSRIFSRDCPEFSIRTPAGNRLVVILNHLKSKGYGSQASSNARRKKQAQRAAEIYQERRAEGIDNIIVLGDFNDTPTSDPLSPLLVDTDLKDVFVSPHFIADGHPGTFANGTKSQKLDYILLSPALFGRVQSAGVHRKGVWGNKDGKRWPILDTMTRKEHAASDHAVVWADLDI